MDVQRRSGPAKPRADKGEPDAPAVSPRGDAAVPSASPLPQDVVEPSHPAPVAPVQLSTPASHASASAPIDDLYAASPESDFSVYAREPAPTRARYLEFHTSHWALPPFEPPARHEALLRSIAVQEPDAALRRQALEGVRRKPLASDLALLRERLQAGLRSPARSTPDLEGELAVQAWVQLCAQQIPGHPALREELERAAAQVRTAPNRTCFQAHILTPWLEYPDALRHLAAFRFHVALASAGPVPYLAHREQSVTAVLAHLRRSGSAAALDRARFLEEKRLPLLIHGDWTPAFNGDSIILTTGLPAESMEELTHAQQFLGTDRADVVKVMHPRDCPTRDAFLLNNARMEAEAKCSRILLLAESGTLDGPVPEPEDERVRQLWLRLGPEPTRAQLETELLEGEASVGDRSYASTHQGWWDDWAAVQLVESRAPSHANSWAPRPDAT